MVGVKDLTQQQHRLGQVPGINPAFLSVPTPLSQITDAGGVDVLSPLPDRTESRLPCSIRASVLFWETKGGNSGLLTRRCAARYVPSLRKSAGSMPNAQNNRVAKEHTSPRGSKPQDHARLNNSRDQSGQQRHCIVLALGIIEPTRRIRLPESFFPEEAGPNAYCKKRGNLHPRIPSCAKLAPQSRLHSQDVPYSRNDFDDRQTSSFAPIWSQQMHKIPRCLPEWASKPYYTGRPDIKRGTISWFVGGSRDGFKLPICKGLFFVLFRACKCTGPCGG
jgi:hypothetical protein